MFLSSYVQLNSRSLSLWDRFCQSVPVIVPLTTVPFFSSMSTTSPASFIKNLMKEGKNRSAMSHDKGKTKNWNNAQCNEPLRPSNALRTLASARIEFRCALKTGSRKRSCIVPDQLHDGRVLNSDVYCEFQQKRSSVDTSVSQSRRRMLHQRSCDGEVSLLGTAGGEVQTRTVRFSYFWAIIREILRPLIALFRGSGRSQIAKLGDRFRARFYAVPSELVT